MLRYTLLLLLIAFLAFLSGGLSAPVHAVAGAGATAQANVASTDTGVIQGDADCSGVVDVGDVVQLLKLKGGAPADAGCADSAGDVDCVGGTTVADALWILRFLGGVPMPTPAGCSAINAAVVIPPTSEELIAAALAAGSITYEQSLLYRALALYDSPGLPAVYRSPIPDLAAGRELFLEVARNETHLSQGLLDQLAPFRARPADPISIFNNPPNSVSAQAPAAWKSLLAAGGAARVWLRDTPGVDYQLTTDAAAVTKVWNALPGIFRYGIPDTPGDPSINPDNAIDIYFVDTGSIDPRMEGCDAAPSSTGCALAANGLTTTTEPNAGNTWSAYVLISTARQGDALTNTLAHELGHVGQFAYDAYESPWLEDSTATWTAFRVVQKVGATQTYTYNRLPAFFKGLNKPLTRDTTDDLNRYGSWLYFYFASMEKGDSIVTDIWSAAAADGVQGEKAVDQVFPFDAHFGAFSVRNWNQEPVSPQYKDAESTFPNEKPKALEKSIAGDDTTDLDTPVSQLSSVYYDFTFDAAVRKVTFKNKLNGVSGAHVWAIKKIGDAWQTPEDWTKEPEKVFCRDNAHEDLAGLIIIVSNADLKNPLPAKNPQVVSEDAGCAGWEGTATVTEHLEIPNEVIDSSLVADVLLTNAYPDVPSNFVQCEPPGVPVPGAPLVPCEIYHVGIGSLTYSYSSLVSTSQCTEIASPQSFDLPTGGVPDVDGNLIIYTDPDPDQYYGLLRSSFTFEKTDDCPGGTPTTGHVPVTFSWLNPNTAVFNVSADGKTIDGTATDGNNFNYTWHLERVGP